ncbi:MAG: DUF4091 domain-containing protein [Phycisphaerales bacterium]|nr:DUF4091 domain-containing protein [Phycisphaerales bacterium]
MGDAGPLPSLRLKSYRAGQQWVQYLHMLHVQSGEPHWKIARWLQSELALTTSFTRTHAADAGATTWNNLDPSQLERLRIRVGAWLERN